MRRLVYALVLATALALAIPTASYATVYVSAAGSDGNDGSIGAPFATVQKGIDTALLLSDPRVEVGPGSFVGNITMRDGVSVYGAGPGVTTLQGSGAGSVVSFAGIGAGETLDGFTVTGGRGFMFGGGIWCVSSSPTITNNQITGNTAPYGGGGIWMANSGGIIANNAITSNEASVSGDYSYGGGIYCENSSTTIESNIITDNDCDYRGGGIGVYQGTPLIQNNIIGGNTAVRENGGGIGIRTATVRIFNNSIAGNDSNNGGGVSAISSTLVIDDNQFSMNSSRRYGGGMYGESSVVTFTANTASDNVSGLHGGGAMVWGGTRSVFEGNTFSGNGSVGGYGGGGLAVQFGPVTVRGNTFDSNTASWGGGLQVYESNPAVIDGNLIQGNSVAQDGGGIMISGIGSPVYSATVTNNLIVNNSAYYGGGVETYYNDALLMNNTIAYNSVDAGGGWGGGIYRRVGTPVVTNCIIWGNTGAIGSQLVGVAPTYSCVQGGSAGVGNTASDPLFVDSANNDYRLSAGSPGIDAATQSGAPLVDYAGVPRPQAANIDMGAYEYLPAGSPTALTLSNDSIVENAGADALIGTLSSTDPDPMEAHTYSVVGGADAAAFTVSGDELRAANGFDFETKNSLSVMLRTTNSAGLSFTDRFTITISDANDAPSDISLSSGSIAENAGAGVAVGTLSSTDQDAADTHTYSVVGGADAGDFSINGAELRADANFDFEVKDSYEVVVRTTDSGAGMLSFDETFTITVSDANDAPSDILLSSGSIAENAGADVPVGTLSSTDQDAADTHDYSIVGGADAGDFSISGAELRAVADFDFEAQSSYEVVVRTTDSGTGTLSFDETFSVLVTDVNEAPSATGDSVSVFEDTLLTVPFADLVSNDADPDSGSMLSPVSETAVSQGTLMRLGAGFEYMPLPDYFGDDAFTYRATDGQLQSEACTVSINVEPVNDPPSFTSGGDVVVLEDSGPYLSPWAGAISAGPLNEAGQMTSFETTNTDNALFDVSPSISSTGALSFAPAANASGVATVTVTLKDDATAGGAALSHSETFKLTIDAMPEETAIVLSSTSQTLPQYGSSYLLTGRLTADAANGLSGRVVKVQVSSTGVGFVDTGVTAVTLLDGSFAVPMTPRNSTHYRVSFAGDPDYLASTSASVKVIPRARVTAPGAEGPMYAGVKKNVTGTISPEHEAGSPVRVYRYRYVSGAWKSYGYVSGAVVENGFGYSASLALPYPGAWRLRTYCAADAGHASSWSPYTSLNVQTTGDRAVAIARTLVGRPYQWGGTGPFAFDSSGFTRYVYGRVGIWLPRTAAQQYVAGVKVTKSNLKPGDLVYYYSPIRHVAIYAGNGKIVGPSHLGYGVAVRQMYWSGYVGATRPSAK